MKLLVRWHSFFVTDHVINQKDMISWSLLYSIKSPWSVTKRKWYRAVGFIRTLFCSIVLPYNVNRFWEICNLGTLMFIFCIFQGQLAINLNGLLLWKINTVVLFNFEWICPFYRTTDIPSGNICPGFKSQDGFPRLRVFITWWPTWQPSPLPTNVFKQLWQRVPLNDALTDWAIGALFPNSKFGGTCTQSTSDDRPLPN